MFTIAYKISCACYENSLMLFWLTLRFWLKIKTFINWFRIIANSNGLNLNFDHTIYIKHSSNLLISSKVSIKKYLFLD